MTEGFFLSEEALSKVRDLFAAFKSTGAFSAEHARRKSAVVGVDWSSFDQLYLALYEMNLFGSTAPEVTPNPGQDGLVKRLSLRLLVDRDLPSVTAESTFEESLIDEFLVSDLIKLRGQIEDIIIYPTQLVEFKTGCIFLEFNVYANPSEARAQLPTLSQEAVNASSIWQRIRTRFQVADLELNYS